MILSGRIPPIAVLSFFAVGISEVGQLRKAKKRRKRQKGGRPLKKVIYLTLILLHSFF